MKKNVFSGVPVCHDFKGALKGKMRTGIWVTWTKIVGGGGEGGGAEESFHPRLKAKLKLLWGCVRATRSLHDEVPVIYILAFILL